MARRKSGKKVAAPAAKVEEPKTETKVEEVQEAAPVEEVAVEENKKVESDDDEVPELEEQEAEPVAETPSTVGAQPTAYGSKKTRKAMAKLGFAPFDTCTRISMRKGQQVLYIKNPDIYRAGNTNGFVFFGKLEVEDMKAKFQKLHEVQKMMQEQGMPEMPADLSNLAGADGMPDMAAIQDLANKMKIGGENAAAPVQAPVTASVTEATEFEEKDIELVMNQVECSRDAAIKGLQNNDGDVVNTIMDLVGSVLDELCSF